MGFAIGMGWAVVAAWMVGRLLEREVRRRTALSTEADLDATLLGLPQPSVGATVTFFFVPAAVVILGWYRGIRGVLEGLGVLGATTVGAIATSLALALLRAAANGTP